jgi:hypothetical protein
VGNNFKPLASPTDALDDLFIGEPGNGNGRAHRLEGAATPATLSVVFTGAAAGDQSGSYVNYVGDINGDGCTDVLIGSQGADRASPVQANAGAADLVYGSGGTCTPPATVHFTGGLANEMAGASVAGVDLNGDGRRDLVIGAPSGSGGGRVFVVYVLPAPTNTDLQFLNGTNGFYIISSANINLGFSVANAGDMNGDGKEDLLIGAPNALGTAGQAFVIFGRDPRFTSSTLDVSTLDGSNGFRINGSNAGDQLGYSVASAGDLDGFGLDEILIGAPGTAGNTGAAYILWGKSSFPADESLNDLEVLIQGANSSDRFGAVVSGAGTPLTGTGDFNNDNRDDVLIGAPNALVGGSSAGKAYLIFNPSPLTTISASQLDGTNGIELRGDTTGLGTAGTSVSTAGNMSVHTGTCKDLAIGDPGFNGGRGKVYVVFGFCP